MNGVDSNSIQVIGADGIIGALKRPLETDQLDGDLIPAKKLSEVSDLNMGDTDTVIENFSVPEKVVGLVIGKGGSEIRLIQQTSGCQVQMDPDGQSNNGLRNCTIEGPPEQVAVAREMISQVINRNETNAAFGAVQGEITEELMIPADKIGLIIGKGGDTIRAIQEQTRLRSCNVVQNTTTATGQPKPFRMIGTLPAIEAAKLMVYNIMNNLQTAPGIQKTPYHSTGGQYAGYGGQDSQAKGEVVVPRSSAGMIIGKGGETIKRLAIETGTKIQFKPDSNPNSEERIAVIMGTRDQIYRATEKITEIVNRSAKSSIVGGGAGNGSYSGQSVFYLHVPAAKCGLVIGKGGENIKQIERETGATCGLAPASEQKNEDEKVFEIKGSQFQIHHASHLVKIKVGEIAPNTPVPPLQGGYQQLSQQPHQPHQSMYNGAAQNGGYQTVATSGFVHQPQAQQYVPAVQQQPQWASQTGAAAPRQVQPDIYQNAIQQPQVTTTTGVLPQTNPDIPTVNPTTGAPDYSAQWAAYYRSIGLMDQAAMVESQMRRNQAAAAVDVQAAPQVHQQFYAQ